MQIPPTSLGVFLYCYIGETSALLFATEPPPPSVADCESDLSNCLTVPLFNVVSVDVRGWKEPAPPAPADMGAPVWTTGLGSSASVWMASPAGSVRNVSTCLWSVSFLLRLHLLRNISSWLFMILPSWVIKLHHVAKNRLSELHFTAYVFLNI